MVWNTTGISLILLSLYWKAIEFPPFTDLRAGKINKETLEAA